jgi:hypothetical protein
MKLTLSPVIFSQEQQQQQQLLVRLLRLPLPLALSCQPPSFVSESSGCGPQASAK